MATRAWETRETDTLKAHEQRPRGRRAPRRGARLVLRPTAAGGRPLGVEDDCSDEALRTAYRIAVFENHPDRGGTEAAMKAINAAFERMARARGL